MDEKADDCFIPSVRKRTRVESMEMDASSKQIRVLRTSTSLDHIVALQIHQDLRETECSIADYMKRMRSELTWRQKHHQKLLAQVFHVEIGKKIKEKDEAIQILYRWNGILEDTVGALEMESQTWRDLSERKESEANFLEYNLEQVLVHINENRLCGGASVEEDSGSRCGSCDPEISSGRRPSSMEGVGEKKRSCRRCEEREARVLLMPCRHLCLCTVCGSCVRCCPVCSSQINATLNLNMP